MRLKDKVAVITGAGGGIGRESALLFAKEGAAIVVVDVNDEAGNKTVEMVRSQEGRAVYVHADVSNAADCERMIAVAEQEFGKLDALFNNAGVMHHSDDNAVTTEEAIWDLTMNINAKGVFFGCKYGIPALRRAGGGSIINTASFVALMGAATPQIAYTASKGAVLALTRELAVIHARENIRVNALCPGPLRTELLMSYLNTEEKKQRRLVHIPMGRFGEAKEIAQAALFLASDESSYITGVDFLVDGGITAAYVDAGMRLGKRSMEDLIRITRRIFDEKYPTANVILLAGSLLRGEGTPYSDLDLVVIFERLPHAWRESFDFQGFPVEAFVHDPETLNYFLFESCRSSTSPAIAQMVLEGIEVPGPSEISKALKRIASDLIASGPPELGDEDERKLRYTITNLVDDIRQPRSREELVASGAELYRALAYYYFRANGLWPAVNKTIPRTFSKADPDLYSRFHESFDQLFAGGRGDKVITLAEEILKPRGGFLFDGYKQDASPESRKPLA